MNNKSMIAITRLGKYDGFTTNLLVGEINTGYDEILMQITNVEPEKMQSLHQPPNTNATM